MKIVYIDHLIERIELRGIPYDLPKVVYQSREEVFFDTQTNHFVALSKKEYFGKLRTLVVPFDKFSDRIELISIHPIRERRKLQRVESGRWVKE